MKSIDRLLSPEQVRRPRFPESNGDPAYETNPLELVKTVATTALALCMLAPVGVPAQARTWNTANEIGGAGPAPGTTRIELHTSTHAGSLEIPYRYTQALTTIAQAGNAAAPAPADAASPNPARSKARVTPEQLRWRNAAIIGGAVGLVAAYGMNNWWQDGFTGSFRTVSEGWFGQPTRYGGADKLGHAFFSYSGARVLTAVFGAAGNDAKSAADLGALWSLGIMTGVEILDGYSRQYSFSSEDAIMNIVGAAAGYIMERNPELDSLLAFRLHYRPSESGNYNIGGDYSGQTYLLAVKASGIPVLRDNSVLRYFELAVGYGTRGYESPSQLERSRNVYFGITLDLSELLGQTVFRSNRERTGAQRASDLFFELIQPPGTVLPLAKHRL